MPTNLFNIDDALLFESELNEEDKLIMETQNLNPSIKQVKNVDSSRLQEELNSL